MTLRYYLITIAVIMSACGGEKGRIQPQRKDITEWVYASVTVKPDSLYKAYALVSGILEEVLVREGDTVSRGSPLFNIRNTNPELEVRKLRLEYELAKDHLNENDGILKSLSDQIRAGQLKMYNDSVNYCRQSNLWGQHIGSKVEYEAKKLAYELSKEELDQLNRQYNRTKRELQTRARQAELTLKSSQVTSGDFVIRSEQDGKVYGVYREKGELVNSLEPLASIGSTTNYLLEMLVDEKDIVKVTKGQLVLVSLEAYHNRAFEARVSRILPDKDIRNQTFRVEAHFEAQPKVLYPGLAGEANISVKHKKDVLVIPLSYLVDESSVRTQNGIVKIETGLRNLEYIEVKKGLDENSWLEPPEK